jgi:hypothetical protein
MVAGDLWEGRRRQVHRIAVFEDVMRLLERQKANADTPLLRVKSMMYLACGM